MNYYSTSLQFNPTIHSFQQFKSVEPIKAINLKAHVKLGFSQRMRTILIYRALPTNAIMMPLLMNELMKYVG